MPALEYNYPGLFGLDLHQSTACKRLTQQLYWALLSFHLISCITHVLPTTYTMQYRSRVAAPASPNPSNYASSSMAPSSRSSSTHSYDAGSNSSLIFNSEEEPEDFGDPDVLAHDICDFFGGVPAPKKPKKVKAPKQKPVKVELPVGAATGAQTSANPTSRLRRICKAMVPVSSASLFAPFRCSLFFCRHQRHKRIAWLV